MRVSVLTILMAFLLAAGIPFGVMAGPAADTDNDTVPDVIDNCLTVPNGAAGDNQCDHDGDGYGNSCDADINYDGVIDVADYPAIDNNIGDTAPYTVPGSDITCNGTVDVGDYPPIDNNIGGAPGPSGYWCAGLVSMAGTPPPGALTSCP